MTDNLSKMLSWFLTLFGDTCNIYEHLSHQEFVIGMSPKFRSMMEIGCTTIKYDIDDFCIHNFFILKITMRE